MSHVCSAHPSACTVKLSYGYSSPRPFNWTAVLVLVYKHGRRSDYTAFNIFSALPGRKTAGLAPFFFILGQLLGQLCGVRPSQKDKSTVLQAKENPLMANMSKIFLHNTIYQFTAGKKVILLNQFDEFIIQQCEKGFRHNTRTTERGEDEGMGEDREAPK